MAVKIPSGIPTSRFLRLCSVAPAILITDENFLRDFGIGIDFSRVRYSRVRDWGDANAEAAKRLFFDRSAILFGIALGAADPPTNSLSVPFQTSSPPRSPRPGPM